jgi:hypothetical protein
LAAGREPKFLGGVPELNEYLKRSAHQNQKKNAARTYLVARVNRVVGYFLKISDILAGIVR